MSEADSVKDSGVGRADPLAALQIRQSLLILPNIIIALSSIQEEIRVRWVAADGLLVLLDRLPVLLERVMAAADAAEDAPVLVAGGVGGVLELQFLLFCRFEIDNRFLESLQEKFAPGSAIISVGEAGVVFYYVVEIDNRQLMIFHILINLATGEVHGFILVDFFEDLGVAFEGVMILLRSMVHHAQMMLTAYEIRISFQAFFEHLYRHIIQLGIVLAVFGENEFGFPLVREAFLVENFGVGGLHFDGAVVVIMRFVEFWLRLPIQKHITSIEIDIGVIWVELDGFVEIALCILYIIVLVAGEASVIKMRRRRIDDDRLIVILYGLLVVLLFKIR